MALFYFGLFLVYGVVGGKGMKAYNKYEVDEIFSSWQSDLEQLSVLEVYTKSDIVTMLTELKSEIGEHTMTSGVTNQDTWNECIACCSRVIQQKINSLKGEE